MALRAFSSHHCIANTQLSCLFILVYTKYYIWAGCLIFNKQNMKCHFKRLDNSSMVQSSNKDTDSFLI